MKVVSISGSSKAASAAATRLTLAPGWRGSSIEPALMRFASELSPASGQEYFELLVEFVAECLGFEAVVVGELMTEGGERFVPIADFPPRGNGDIARADLEIPLVGSDGQSIGLICGFGYEPALDRRTTRMLFRMVAHRAAAELERLRAQRELRRRDALFIGLTTEAHDVVAVIDERGAFTAVSPAIERVLGHQPADCVGVTVTDLVHPLDRASIDALLRIPDAHGYSSEARLHHKSGAWVTMAVTLAEHTDSDGSRFKVLSARDLTDQRRLEDRLRQSQKTEIIGRLASGIAHDFGNILMVVGSHADIMRLRTTADDPRHADVDAIQAAVTRGADLARQLLAFSRHREFEIKRMDINACIAQLATLLRRLVGSAIRVNTALSPEARFIAADATQIEQIVLNLTLNARDAMPNGGTITFATTPAGGGALPEPVAAAPGEYVCFSVTDTGCGIPDEVKPRIFEPQFTTKQDGAGTGMGLANVLDIVNHHGGHIDVDSQDGKGATFRVFLPRTAAAARKLT
jgi:PAS domain S-box-containing protein